MTKEQLLKKNREIAMARQLKNSVKETKIVEEKPCEEELPHKEVIEEEGSKREEEPAKAEAVQKTTPKKKGGRKPVNREYMVVDKIGIEEESDEHVEPQE